MESNEKKAKRPRIGQNQENERNEHTSFEKISTGSQYMGGEHHGAEEAEVDGVRNNQRPYYNRQGSHYGPNNGQQRPYGNYNNRQGDYQARPYRQHNYNAHQQNQEGENNNYNSGYNANRPNKGGYNSYDNNRQGGGYNSNYNNRQNGYNNRNNYNNRQGGGYSNNRQNGYNNRQGGYGNNRQDGAYNNRNNNGYGNQEGGYYNNRHQNRQGGFNNNRQYNNFNRQNNGNFQTRGKSFTPRPKRVEYEMPVPAPDEQIRLNKFLANAGLCSRREADEYIQSGKILVNGVPATELGTKITHSDVVEYNGKVVTLENKCYILLNKPKDCVTTSDDPNGRLTVMDLVRGACDERIYPVGRLDRNTTGVLLLTNDGDLASKLTHPQYVKKKIYHVWTDKDVTEDDMQRIADGIELEDGEIHADAISYATETDRNQIGIEIHSGRNRIVRRIFESLGYHVTKLDRVYFAGLTKKNLPRGRWRYLTQQEVNFLKMGSFE